MVGIALKHFLDEKLWACRNLFCYTFWQTRPAHNGYLVCSSAHGLVASEVVKDVGFQRQALKYNHSALIRNLIKLKGTAKLTAQGERACLKDSKFILFEILENRTRKGCTSSCRPSKPDSAIWPAPFHV